jgi:NAD(P)-dependent dehydrogenase (short-subunit alcohol dehydrogenase family)
VLSDSAQLGAMEGAYASYRVSNVALNALTRVLAAEEAGAGVSAASVSPGRVKTDMGGAGAERSVEEGADTIVWLATSPTKHTGGFYRDRRSIAW